MSRIIFHQFRYASDNYGVLIHDEKSGETAAIDAGDPQAYQANLLQKGWSLSHIFVTHHHLDHVAGLSELKAEFNCRVYGPMLSSASRGLVDDVLQDGAHVAFGETAFQVIATPGHTLDMLNYYCQEHEVLFAGDTLFALGCGRLFEGTPEMMWHSLQKLKVLPDRTQVYCGHEYTQSNGRFALHVDAKNTVLRTRMREIDQRRQKNQPTIPTTIGQELATNPFMRCDDPEIRNNLGMARASEVEVFTRLRKMKDAF